MNATLQLFARKYGSTEWILLDLYESEPIRLNLRVQDIVEPSLTVASYSQSFRVPHTYINGKFFQQIFNVNQTLFDPSKKAQAYINAEGQFYMNGNIQLLNVYRNESTNNVEYEIIFVNELSDFASQIGLGSESAQQGGYLSNLDVSEYTHPKDRQTIVNSWYGDLFEGDIVYPLIEWGYSYTGSGVNTVPTLPTISTAGVRSFTDPSFPLNVGQMKPAIRVKAIWDKIFEQTDFTYESDFLNTDEFKSLYLVTDKEARAEINVTIGLNFSYYGFNFIPQLTTATSPILIYPNNVLFDFGSNLNLNSYVFNVTADGEYRFRMTCNYTTFRAGGTTGNEVFVFFLKQGPFISSPTYPSSQASYFFPPGETQGSFSVTTPPYTFTKGQEIYFFAQMVQVDPGNEYYFNQGNISTTVTPGSVIVPNNNLPDNIKQIDFIRGISERYKLVFEPTFLDEKKFYIEPWSEWIKGGIVRDWTDKLNGEKDYKLTPLFQTQNRFMIFKDDEDSDYLNYNYQQAFKQTYGQVNRDSYIEILKDTKEIRSMFAPLPLGPVGYSGTGADDILKAEKWLIPHIAKDEVSQDGPGKRTPIQPKLRLGYYNGMTGASKDWYLEDGTALSEYPLMSSYWPNPWSQGSKSTDWGYAEPQWDPEIPGNPEGRADNYNFDLYWSKWYQSCYGEINITPEGPNLDKDFSYLFEGEFILDYKDLVDLRFNDKIFVKDAYYLIDSIQGFSPHEASACKVILYKLNNIGLQLPLAFLPITDICYSPDTLCDAACCQFRSPISTVFSSDAPDLVVGSNLFLNAAGSVPAPVGFYSDGTNVYTVTSVGTVSAVTSIEEEECECIPPLGIKELCYIPGEGAYCEACCCTEDPVNIWVEDNTSTWWQNTFFYETELGGVAPDGWYSDGTRYVYLSGGIPSQTGVCTDCNCLVFDLTPFGACVGETLCEAACCTNTLMASFFSDDPELGLGANVYSDDTGTLLDDGWYFTGTVAIEVSGGEIVTIGDASSCEPCANETLDYYFDFSGCQNGTGAFSIQKSNDGIVWIPEYSKDLSTVAASGSFNYTGPLAPNTFLRGSLTYGADHGDGTFRTSIEQTNSTLNSQNTVRFGNYTYTPINPAITGGEIRFSVNLDCPTQDCTMEGGVAWACTELACIIDEDNSVYTIANDITACCDPLYVDNAGYGHITEATLTIDGNCETPESNCYGCGNQIDGNTQSPSYLAFPPYFICDDIESPTISITWNTFERPNRFTWYDNSGLIATTGWVGFATYPGPWGLSLNTATDGVLTIPYVAGEGLYLFVEAGPANPEAPAGDFWTADINCNNTCSGYTNFSSRVWIGDYQDCSGDWQYAQTVQPNQSICARVGTPFTVSGTDLLISGECN